MFLFCSKKQEVINSNYWVFLVIIKKGEINKFMALNLLMALLLAYDLSKRVIRVYAGNMPHFV